MGGSRDDLTPELLLKAYRMGIFPMADARDDPDLYWISPEMRGVLPLDSFHVAKRLARTVRKNPFEIRLNTAFRTVMELCASPQAGRKETWINDQILDLYTALNGAGHAHSLECWREGRLVGGLYGVHVGGAFFGESMFSLETDASKVALIHLAARLIHGGFRLLDAQFVTDHLTQFGAIEIPKSDYLMILNNALTLRGDYYKLPSSSTGSEALQLIAQTS